MVDTSGGDAVRRRSGEVERIDEDSARQDAGKEGGESSVDRQGVDMEGDVEPDREEYVVVDGGGRR
jgi:hypothetical protein